MIQSPWSSAIGVFVAMLSGTGSTPLFAETRNPSFRNEVIPVLTKAGCNSGACHGALAGKGGLKLSLRGYDPESDHFILTRQAGGRRIDTQSPENSLLIQKPLRKLPHGGGKRFEADSPDLKVLIEWIRAGCPGPRSDDPALTRLEVEPRAATISPKDSLQVKVRAIYSDGRSADVSHWAKYTSTDDWIAQVDDQGQVTGSGHGQAAINVIFGSQVATITVTSPFPNKVPAAIFAASPRYHFVDEHILKKLQQLRLPPSGQCSDREFIRRAFLDAAGILPSPDEVQQFLADAAPDKRSRLVDRLLQRPEYVDYWTYKWSDLLLVSSRRIQPAAMWAYYQFIRTAVAANWPWDRFAREILTSSGSTLQNGAANYFVLHKDIAQLTEATSVTFMGVSLTCCRCHNHPLEKWTQDQYWSMANLFARVTLKNGDRSGEIIVQEQPAGDVPHPRRDHPMPPAPLDAPPLHGNESRREYFAQWLTAPENPYFAKAIVNRVWRHFMGRGLIEAEDDLRETNPPSNAELLEALVRDFVAHGFDMKHLIRTIMTSAAYQRSSQPQPGNQADDRFYSRFLIRRLPAEVILDAYSSVTGIPTAFDQVYTGVEGGTAPTSSYPKGLRALQLPDTQVASHFLNTFGRPERLAACSCERQQEATVGQALHLNNGQTLNDKLRDPRSRVSSWLKENVSDEEVVRRVFELALSRLPTQEEQARFVRSLKEAGGEPSSRREAIEDVFWAVLTSREFLFNH
jgi:hypothetical protein